MLGGRLGLVWLGLLCMFWVKIGGLVRGVIEVWIRCLLRRWIKIWKLRFWY
jgi:hypothetical protein